MCSRIFPGVPREQTVIHKNAKAERKRRRRNGKIFKRAWRSARVAQINVLRGAYAAAEFHLVPDLLQCDFQRAQHRQQV